MLPTRVVQLVPSVTVFSSLIAGKTHFSTTGYKYNPNDKPEPDKLLKDIASYVHNTKVTSKPAFDTAKLCFLDTLGCGLAALKHKPPQRIIKPIVPGMSVPNGAKVLGTKYRMDPVAATFALGALFRWLGYNDRWLASEWGHPSDNLAGILAVADYMTRLSKSSGGDEGRFFTVHDVLEALIKAYEIQGIIALDNNFNEIGLDHVVLVKIATAAVVSKMLHMTEAQTVETISQAFVDGHPLRTYRYPPNTGSRKFWAAADASSRAVKLAFLVKYGHIGGVPSVLTAKKWGFYDVFFNGKPFNFKQRTEFGSYVMENIVFNVSYPAELHAQTAVEGALEVRRRLDRLGKTYKDISSIQIRTHDVAAAIVDNPGPLHDFTERRHSIQYMVTIPLIYGRLTADDYYASVALNPEVEELRSKIHCIKDEQFTKDYHDPEKRAIPNALSVQLKDGTVVDDVLVQYPIGHRFRRKEAVPLLLEKFYQHLSEHFHGNTSKIESIMSLISEQEFEYMPIDEYIDNLC
ncbi:HGR002Wp [Eremothecium sinecaudum]|uniref:HGR002Wp n=1 Tax=Eremothecium sinecaudum TaxID=45286 RepID=A0A0X8HVM2_9SACH|nr:HGR002Wp [Eremothecium sinecaudum]AMD22341.1 HGR002Wp [Eremothecium sinecaudum]